MKIPIGAGYWNSRFSPHRTRSQSASTSKTGYGHCSTTCSNRKPKKQKSPGGAAMSFVLHVLVIVLADPGHAQRRPEEGKARGEGRLRRSQEGRAASAQGRSRRRGHGGSPAEGLPDADGAGEHPRRAPRHRPHQEGHERGRLHRQGRRRRPSTRASSAARAPVENQTYFEYPGGEAGHGRARDHPRRAIPTSCKSAGRRGRGGRLVRGRHHGTRRYRRRSRFSRRPTTSSPRPCRTALPSMRFLPAEVGGKKVKQLVQQPFVFNIMK